MNQRTQQNKTKYILAELRLNMMMIKYIVLTIYKYIRYKKSILYKNDEKFEIYFTNAEIQTSQLFE